MNRTGVEIIPQIFTTIGILGTFGGIAVGMWFFNVKDIDASIPKLLDSFKPAFAASILGILLSLIFSGWIARIQKELETQIELQVQPLSRSEQSLEAILTELKSSKSERVLYKTAFDDVLLELRSTNALIAKQFSQVGLFTSIDSEIKNLHNTLHATNLFLDAQFTANGLMGNIHTELQTLRKHAEAQPTVEEKHAELTKQFLYQIKQSNDGIENRLQAMMQEFGSIIEHSIQMVVHAQEGSILSELKAMRGTFDRLGEQIKSGSQGQLEELVAGLKDSLITLMEEFNSSLNGSAKEEFEALSKLLKEANGTLQALPDTIVAATMQMTEQADQLKAEREYILAQNEAHRDALQTAYDSLNNSINQSRKLHEVTASSISDLKRTSDTLNKTSDRLGTAYNEFVEQNKASRESMAELQASLQMGSDTYAEYIENFDVVEKGLKDIFTQIQGGLNQYSTQVERGLTKYLDDYNKHLKQTVDALHGASQLNTDLLNELTDQLEKFKQSTSTEQSA